MPIQDFGSQKSGLSAIASSPLTKIIMGGLTGGAGGAALGAIGGNPSDATALTAMKDKASEVDPSQVIEHGIAMLDHPDTPPDIREMAAPYLLGAKHFGGDHPAIYNHTAPMEQENNAY